MYWLDGTPASVIEDILKNKTNIRYIFLIRKFSNAYILEKFELLTKEFKFLNNTLKKLKKEHETGVIFDKGFGTSYTLVNKTIKNKFQHCNLYEKDKNPQSVAVLINFYFKY